MGALLFTCASYHEHYARAGKGWALEAPPEAADLAYRTYLIGDAGNAKEGKPLAVMTYLEEELATAPASTSIIFLGDNLYPDGMPPRSAPERELAEHRLDAQLAPLMDFGGKILFVPGNHDWYRHSIEGLKRQRKYLEKALDQKKIWAPKEGCGGPDVLEVHDNLVYIVIDSQWWLAKWNKHPGINEGCDASNRVDFLRRFTDAVKGNKEKNIVVVMHHPMETFGPHGGHFPLSDHLFPLRRTVNKNLWIPLPGLGSIMPFLRTNVGSKQDNFNASFQELKRSLLETVQLNGNVTFVSGHEHSLQYIENDNQRYIVSGSASKVAPVGLGEGSFFSYGGLGYSVLDLYTDGSMWVSFYSVDEYGKQNTLLYRREIQAPPPADNYELPSSFDHYPLPEDATISSKLVNGDYTRSRLGLLVLGEHYRKSFAQTLSIPMLDLGQYRGGVIPVKKGGGNQTQSVRLEAGDGRQYTMRSLEKDPTATVGYTLSQSRVVRKLIKDAFTAAHPLSALPVTGLAEAATVNHTHPELFYIPAQPSLGKYNPQFGNKVYLVEERPDDDLWEDQEQFGNPADIVSTPKVLAGLRKDHDYRLDVPAMARARAFDLLLGDWDRHDDQWRWVVDKRGDAKYYIPIPRDRDQAFSNYDGLLLAFARLLAPDTRPLAPFRAHPKRIHWATHGNRFFDATFLSEISWEVWEREIRHLQATVTDDVIEAAFREAWPKEVFAADGPGIIAILKERRDKLREIIRDLYEFRAREVEIAGTDKGDHFDLITHSNGDLEVKLFDANKEGEAKGEARYQRYFYATETDEIILYALDGDDTFDFSGEEKSRVKIRLVGGPGKDRVTSPVGHRQSRTAFYDYTEEIETSDLGDLGGLKDRRSVHPRYNTYSRLSLDKNYNFFSLLPIIGVNPDNGLLLGAGGTYTTYGFKKRPFATRQSISGQYAFSTGGARFDYHGEFTDLFGENELVFTGAFRSAFYGVNFYGIGNDTENTEAINGDDYHRVRQELIRLAPSIARRLDGASILHLGPEYTSISTNRTEERFLADNFEDPEGTGVFDKFEFLSLKARFSFDNRNSAAQPTKGLTFFAELGNNWSLRDNAANVAHLKTSLSITQQLDKNGTLVVANRVGFATVFSDDFQYFQAATLGGVGPDANLRGYRRERFSGRSALYLNNDVRLRLINAKRRLIPFSLGIVAGFDLGRVWAPGEDSSTWHRSYGGGIWVSPLDIFTLKFSIFRGNQGVNRPVAGASFFF
ncbi:metallophosphoesterase [Lewinella sp. W8]|uniref:metallophosphoesterase n=1 Tax=Lewinella sp. W8 TaxID=2528208 RepID=UPI0020A67A59|nr:metallophosphoesterase [Lewinella sp. W8]